MSIIGKFIRLIDPHEIIELIFLCFYFILMQSIGFPQQPLYPIAIYGMFEKTLGNAKGYFMLILSLGFQIFEAQGSFPYGQAIDKKLFNGLFAL